MGEIIRFQLMFMYLGGIPIPIEISVARGIQLLTREKRRRRRTEEEEVERRRR